MTDRVLIKYGDVAVGAKDDFDAGRENFEYFSRPEDLHQNKTFPNYSNPVESYSALLDGSTIPFVEQPNSDNGVGLWSEIISSDNGAFAVPVILTVTAENRYSSIGITLTFDVDKGIFATHLHIAWFRDDELISEKEFFPDSAIYLCQNRVEYYNRIVITFYSINMPNNRLRLHGIEYGYGAEFTAAELQNVSAVQEISPLSTEISINTLGFDLISNRDIEFSFQERQTVETYFNGQLRAKTFIKDFKRKSRRQWSVNTEDYIGIMDVTPFYGGVYENASAAVVLKGIFEAAKIPYTFLEDDFAPEELVLFGYIPFTTCRDALMQVCFAIGATVDTSNREDVLIFALPEEEDGVKKIPLSKIMQGQNFETETKLTAFELVAHSYTPPDEEAGWETLYDANKNGTGNNILVKFSEPIYKYDGNAIDNVLEFGENYAIVNAEEGFVLRGKKYDHKEIIKRRTNELVHITDTENVVSVNNATLVSPSNVDRLLDRCYNYLVNTRKVNAKIAETKRTENARTTYDDQVNVGDRVKIATEYLGEIEGWVIRQSFNLNGGIIVKDTVIR